MRQKSPPSSRLRAIPSVDAILRKLGELDIPRAAIVAIIRRELDRFRQDGSMTPDADEQTASRIVSDIREAIDDLRRGRLQTVINGTGIIVHTNFGRAPLSAAVTRSLCDIAANYNNLEFDLETGTRGNRAGYLEHNLAVLCGAKLPRW